MSREIPLQQFKDRFASERSISQWLEHEKLMETIEEIKSRWPDLTKKARLKLATHFQHAIIQFEAQWSTDITKEFDLDQILQKINKSIS